MVFALTVTTVDVVALSEVGAAAGQQRDRGTLNHHRMCERT